MCNLCNYNDSRTYTHSRSPHHRKLLLELFKQNEKLVWHFMPPTISYTVATFVFIKTMIRIIQMHVFLKLTFSTISERRKLSMS